MPSDDPTERAIETKAEMPVGDENVSAGTDNATVDDLEIPCELDLFDDAMWPSFDVTY